MEKIKKVEEVGTLLWPFWPAIVQYQYSFWDKCNDYLFVLTNIFSNGPPFKDPIRIDWNAQNPQVVATVEMQEF